MNKLSIAACLLFLANSNAFVQRVNKPDSIATARLTMNAQGPAGSFFHKVPEGEDDEEAENSSSDLDDGLSEILRQRKKPPLASNPSTIKGVPTSKATGFGKPQAPKKATKPFVAVGPQDPPVNDPTKPEFDDQGYTLYTDKETGKKSRVFEALVDYPCDFTMKIVGANEGAFVEDVVAIVAEACEAEPADIPHRTKAMGKWTSVTVQAPVKSAEMLYTLYEKVDLDPRVKFKF